LTTATIFRSPALPSCGVNRSEPRAPLTVPTVCSVSRPRSMKSTVWPGIGLMR
jgi:hypothetical protein